MGVPAFHEAEHLARQPTHLQRFEIELALERIQRPHDVGNGAKTMQRGVRGIGPLGLREHAGIGLSNHPLTEIDADEIVLKEVVVEHVLGRFAEVDDPVSKRWWVDAECHVLRVASTRCMIVAADPTDAARDEVGVARVLAAHKYGIAAENR